MSLFLIALDTVVFGLPAAVFIAGTVSAIRDLAQAITTRGNDEGA